ncbi:MAG: DUF58 domain-containing protein [Pseudomonadota bacterium]
MTLRWPAIVWIAAIATIGIAGLWMGAPLAGLWRWLTVALMLALLIERLLSTTPPLLATLEQPPSVHLGEPTDWVLHVTNIGRSALRCAYAPRPPVWFAGDLQDAQVRLRPDEHRTLPFSQVPQRLGEHPWPRQPVMVRGLFGLAEWIRSVPLHERPDTEDNAHNSPPSDTADQAPAVTHVSPAMLAGAGRRSALDRLGSTRQAIRSYGGSEFRSLRGYSVGDPPSVIDWKATARSGSLVVRETEEEQQLLILFALDCGRSSRLRVGQLDALGHAVNISARLAELADHAGDRCGLLTYADAPIASVPPGHGPAHLRRLRDCLASCRTQANESNPLSAVIQLARALPQRALVLNFTQLDDATASGQLAEATLLLRPKHLPMVVAVQDESLEQMMQAGSTDREAIFTAIAAREYRRTAARTRASLERMGAVVVEATPDRIEREVFECYRRLRSDKRI